MVTSMTMDQPANIYASDLNGAVGEVMLFWGFLENAMLKALGEASSSTARAPSIVQQWQATFDPGDEIVGEIKEVAAIRHLLAHGLCELEARPTRGGEAHVTCRGFDGALVSITLGKLRETAQRLDLLRLSIVR